MNNSKQLAEQAEAILAQHGHEGHVHGPHCNHDHDHGHHHHHQNAGETFVRNAPKVGRNDPCPCGSGKKHKKCCLA